MKKLSITIIGLLLSKMVICQNITFSKLFGNNDSLLYSGAAITSYNDSIYFSMFDQDQAVSYQAMTFIKTDASGNQCANRRFFKPSYNYSLGLNRSLQLTSDGYLICGGNTGSLLIQGDSGVLIKFDRNTLDTVFTKYYSHGNISGFNEVAELSNGNYVLSGQAGDASVSTNSGWVLETDNQGHIVWQKLLTSDVLNIAGYILPYQGGFYLSWGTGHPYTQSGNPADSAIFLDNYDNNGNLIWRDTFGFVGHDNLSGPFMGLREGGGIATLNILDTTGFQNGPNVIYKFGINGAILWQRYFPAFPLYLVMNSMIETKSGDIVMCGEGYGKLRTNDTILRDGGCILKLDKNGNTIFYQVYDYDSTWEDLLNDITETADGGYACIGQAFQFLDNRYKERAWLLKVDSNGCLNGNCPAIETGITEIPGLANFFVFPNPVSSVFTVALAGPNDLEKYQDLHFMLYDLTGRLVMDEPLKKQTTVLNRNNLINGMFLWQIMDAGESLSSGKLVLR